MSLTDRAVACYGGLRGRDYNINICVMFLCFDFGGGRPKPGADASLFISAPEVISAAALGVQRKGIRSGNGNGREEVVIKHISAGASGINTDGFQSEERRLRRKDAVGGNAPGG